MHKDLIFTGQPIFSQIINFIDKSIILNLAAQFGSDRYYKKFTTYNHLMTMLYGTYHNCQSIREVVTGMQACQLKLNHIGVDYSPRRSTLSEANQNRNSNVFEAIFYAIRNQVKPNLPDSLMKEKWYKYLHIVDSTTISLFKAILKSAGRNPADGKKKGGLKVHTLMKADEDIPKVVKITASSKHDVSFIQSMKLPKGSIVTFDKGYIDYKQYDLWAQEGVIWVTRMKNGAKYETTQEIEPTIEEKEFGITSIVKITLGHTTHAGVTRTQATLINFFDQKTQKEFYFISNNTHYTSIEITQIYKKRWQIELLFKRLKQNYTLENFLGDNVNAIEIQVWCTLIADILIQLIKSKLRKKWATSNLCSMIRIHLMTYIDLFMFLERPDDALINNFHVKMKIREATLF